jgi:hypothetical protein
VRALQTLMQALSGTMPMPRQNAPAFVKKKECNGMVSGLQQSKVKCPCAGAFPNQIRVPKLKYFRASLKCLALKLHPFYSDSL